MTNGALTDDLLNTALAALLSALALTGCERAPAPVNAPFITCNADRTACASSILDLAP